MTDLEPKDYVIFIADDNPENLSLLSNILENEGYRIRAATNGQDVLESLRAETPDILLLDVHMPVLDGYETCLKIREKTQYQDLPILFISALNDSFNRIKSFEAGGNDYIDKPFNKVELLARIRTHLLLSSRTRELERRIVELDKYQTSLIENEKYSYLGYLIVKIAHEINTPLGNCLLANSTMQNIVASSLKEGRAISEEEREQLKGFLDLGTTSLRKMIDLISRFKELEHGIEYSTGMQGLRNLTEEIFKLFKAEFEDKNISYSLDFYFDTDVLVDFQTYYKVMTNLIRNSIDHGVGDLKELHIKVTVKEFKEGLEITYSDDGVGIEVDIRDRIWDPFFTSVPDSEHLGLGLHLVYLFVTRILNGSIRFSPAKDERGATFIFTTMQNPQN